MNSSGDQSMSSFSGCHTYFGRRCILYNGGCAVATWCVAPRPLPDCRCCGGVHLPTSQCPEVLPSLTRASPCTTTAIE